MTTVTSLASRTGTRLDADPSRVVAQLFVAGGELVGGGDSRALNVVARVMALDERVVRRHLDELMARFAHRHRDLTATFRLHADRVANRLDPTAELSEERWLLLGAAFTHEYAVEGASLCNPCMVAHPDQSQAPLGGLRFVMSVRGIGEGHRSSLGFRTGTIGPDGSVSVDEPGSFPALGSVRVGTYDSGVFHEWLRALGSDGESAAYVLDQLGADFTIAELTERLGALVAEKDTRRDAEATAHQMRVVAARSYAVDFAPDTELSERILWPAMSAESHGIEDARFVRFTEDGGAVTYYATYTAFDGTRISQQLLRTADFTTFAMSPMVGPAARNKGMALFPRRVDDRYAALSRYDRETNAIAFSDSLGTWGPAVTFQVPERSWEAVQLGNCGSPIETDAGWLVLTHGVGPMRTYSISALLLDLDDPTKVVATLAEPLLTPISGDRDGYVPNVVYSCGALLHGDTLVLPFGIADSAIGIATVEMADLLGAMS